MKLTILSDGAIERSCMMNLDIAEKFKLSFGPKRPFCKHVLITE